VVFLFASFFFTIVFFLLSTAFGFLAASLTSSTGASPLAANLSANASWMAPDSVKVLVSEDCAFSGEEDYCYYSTFVSESESPYDPPKALFIFALAICDHIASSSSYYCS